MMHLCALQLARSTITLVLSLQDCLAAECAPAWCGEWDRHTGVWPLLSTHRGMPKS